MKWYKKWYRKTFNIIFTENNLEDVKGLQVVIGEVFKEGTTYRITRVWDGWDYLGSGVYMKPTCIQSDVKNPYFLKSVKEQLKGFGNYED